MPKGHGEGSKKTWIKKGSIPANKGKGMKYEIRICTICGSEFTNPQRRVKTCSKECRYKSCSLRNTKVKRVCVVCEKVFEVPRAWIKRSVNDGSYCSVGCRWKNKIYYSKKEKDSARNFVKKSLLNGSIEQKPCCICGDKDSQAHHFKGYDVKNWSEVVWYCSKHHSQEHERLRRLGLTKLL